MKRLASLTVLIIAVSLASLGISGAQAQEFKWTVPVLWNPPHFVRAIEDQFAKDVYKRTNGKLSLSLHQYGELGLVGSNVLTAVRAGQFPLAELDNSKTAGDEPLFLIFNLPGLCFSIHDAKTVAKASEGLMKKALNDWGVREIGLDFYNPAQGIFSKKPIRTIADLKGLKIRVYSSVLQHAFTLLGSRPQLIPWGDTPAALLQGVVNAAITSPSSGISAGFGDTTKYMTTMPLTNRISWIVNKKAWASLPPDIKKVLLEEAAKYGNRIDAKWVAEGKGVAKLTAKAGITFIPPSKKFQASVTKLLHPIWNEWAKKTKYGPQALKLSLAALGRN